MDLKKEKFIEDVKLSGLKHGSRLCEFTNKFTSIECFCSRR